ncbi:RHS repeat-associated core domain-containing protein, partial [Catellatospora methionotrophica]|uniref:RHS repeat-associated core domain-containing protein n=1 Tax=Catellatospora methionotrophica TaxID=121620 RepID=UPI0033D6CE9A
RVRVDYARFAQAYGGSYGARLQLVRLPACVLDTPQLAACRTTTSVPAVHDGQASALTADLGTAGVTVLAAVAGTASDQGDYRATPLAPSATWAAGGSSGDFTWSYPMRVPPTRGELDPDLAISYSSSSIDGRTSGTNNQTSWVGEGFDLSVGYIERSYKSCADDGAPAVNGVKPGDLCWAYDNATVAWGGKGGELIRAADGTWRLRGDDGTRFERLTDTATGNGDNDGEYWKATTVDGTQYFFGRHRLPGWSAGKAQTNAAWTVPVFGNNSGEPCYDASGFGSSWCQQVWRWNLDYVVDTHGNAMTYRYTTETNLYGRNVSASADVAYVRGGHLERIEYGLRTSDLFAPAPARVVFDASERCLADTGFDCDPAKIGMSPDRWRDVPWDQNCTSSCTGAGKISPTFWSRKRLTAVNTQIRRPDGGYRDVDTWNLTHLWADADTDSSLLLGSIQQTGKAATPALTLPPVTFNHVQALNRVDRIGDDIRPFIKYRLGAIYDESGGQLDVTYSTADCTQAGLPAPETNTRRCFPTYWQPPGRTAPILDWFHKYVVKQVIVSDRTARSPDMVTTYDYPEGAAWHFDDDDGLARIGQKTWSQWRGYGLVRVTTGGVNDPLTRDDYLYLRGMDGDRLNPTGGVKTVTVADGEGASHPDHAALAGHLLKHTTYTGPSGSVHTKTVNMPWRQQTASRTRSWGTTTANLTGTATARTWTAMDGGNWRQTRVDQSFDTRTGLPTQIDDQGDTGTATDDRCTRLTYLANTATWLLDRRSRAETVAVRCASTPDRSRQLIADTRAWFDGGSFGATPTRGDVTRQEEVSTHDGTTAAYVATTRTGYDAYGRPATVTDAVGNIMTASYADDTSGLTTAMTVTGPAVPGGAHSQVRTLDPAWGLVLGGTDAGGQTTTATRDALGRLGKVWLPGRAGAPRPDLEYAYQFTENKIVAITTRTLTANGGGQRVSHELFDGLLRSRQKQVPGPGGSRLISDSLYDSRGNLARTYEPYAAAGAPATDLPDDTLPPPVETQHAYSYDGLNRVTVERLLAGNNDSQEQWRTTTTYGGGWTAVDPPEGQRPTRTDTDARGRRTELREYRGSAPTGTYDATRYEYDLADRISKITGADGAVWTFAHDLRGRQRTRVDPDRGTTTMAYDVLDQLTESTDARGQKLVLAYDALGRATSIREGSPSGPLRTSYLYDTVRRGQLTSTTRYVDGKAYVNSVVAYDNNNRPIQSSITVPDALGALEDTYTFGTAYNFDGTVRSTSFPEAGGLPAETVVTTYDDLARPTRLTGNLGSYVTDTKYSPTGQPLQYELSTGAKKAWQTLTWQYGTQRLATSRTDRQDVSGVDQDLTYRYDAGGNIRSILDVSRSGTDNQCLAYDYAQRLTEAWSQGAATCAAAPSSAALGGPAPYWQSFGYDVAGNRTAETLHGTGGQADTIRSYANTGHRLDRVTQTGAAGTRQDVFGYDAAGNTTTRTIGATASTLTWDAGGALTKVTEGTKTTDYIYDAAGTRLVRRDATGTTLYLPGMELHLSAGGATAASGTRYYTHGGKTVAVRTSSGVQLRTADHQDTAQLSIDASTQALTQRRFTPFGAARGTPTGTWLDDKTFVGGTRDAATGLTHLGAREYDPGIGRFISADPLLLDDPQQMQGYSYANNNPVTLSDATGMAPCGGGGTWQYARHGGDPGCGGSNTDTGSGTINGPGSGSSGSGNSGNGSGNGSSGSGSGNGASGSSGHHTPAVGPSHACTGWCAVKDRIGDRQSQVRGTAPQPATAGLACGNYNPLACFKIPDFQPDFPWRPTGKDYRQFFRGIVEKCKEAVAWCPMMVEYLAALFILFGMTLAPFVAGFCMTGLGTAACIIGGIIVGVALAILVVILVGHRMWDEFTSKGAKAEKEDKARKPGNPLGLLRR